MRWAHMISHVAICSREPGETFKRIKEFSYSAQKPQQCCRVSPHQKLGSRIWIHGSAAERTQLLWKRGTNRCPFVVHHLQHLTPHVHHYGWRGIPKSKMSFSLICCLLPPSVFPENPHRHWLPYASLILEITLKPNVMTQINHPRLWALEHWSVAT